MGISCFLVGRLGMRGSIWIASSKKSCKTGPSNRIEEFDNVLDQRFGDNPIDINDDKYKEASEEAKKLLQFLNAFWNMQFVVAEVKG